MQLGRATFVGIYAMRLNVRPLWNLKQSLLDLFVLSCPPSNKIASGKLTTPMYLRGTSKRTSHKIQADYPILKLSILCSSLLARTSNPPNAYIVESAAYTIEWQVLATFNCGKFSTLSEWREIFIVKTASWFEIKIVNFFWSLQLAAPLISISNSPTFLNTSSSIFVKST